MNGARASSGPWYNNDWTDWVNPAAWGASLVMGTWNALAGGYEFLTKDHGAEWADYYARRNANALALSQTGDVAAYQAAERQAIGQQARNVIDDAAKLANGYTTGIQLFAAAPGMIRGGIAMVEAAPAAMRAGAQFVKSGVGAVKSGVQNLICVIQQACFAAGTPIFTPTGARFIESLREGDEVFSRPEDNPNAPVTVGIVSKVFVLTAQIWELYVGGQRIETTAEHPFYVVGEGWTSTNRLKRGDLLKGPDGKVTAVESVVQTSGTETVYNVTIEPDHTFFVGDVVDWGFALWAHNTLCPTVAAALERLGVDAATLTIENGVARIRNTLAALSLNRADIAILKTFVQSQGASSLVVEGLVVNEKLAAKAILWAAQGSAPWGATVKIIRYVPNIMKPGSSLPVIELWFNILSN